MKKYEYPAIAHIEIMWGNEIIQSWIFSSIHLFALIYDSYFPVLLAGCCEFYEVQFMKDAFFKLVMNNMYLLLTSNNLQIKS